MDTANNAMWIAELAPPFENLMFQFVPEDYSWQRTADWVKIPIAGRNNSKKHYTGGEDKLSFTLDFNAMFEQDKNHCINKISWLQSLAIADGYSGPARNVSIRWAQSDIFRWKIWIVRTVTAKASLFNSDYGMNPMQAYIDIELELDTKENSRLSSVRLPVSGILPSQAGGSLNGVIDYTRPGVSDTMNT